MTVDLYIWEQKEPTKSILDYVHHLILHMCPDITYTIKWNVPYYTKEDAVLYLNPIKRKSGGIEVCFPRGRHFKQGIELLDFKDRKVVGGYTLLSLESIDEAALIFLIRQALRKDEERKGTTPWKI